MVLWVNFSVHCEDVPLPMAPSDWFNKQLNGQQLGRRGRVGYLEREGTWEGSEACGFHQSDKVKVGRIEWKRNKESCGRM